MREKERGERRDRRKGNDEKEMRNEARGERKREREVKVL